MRRLEAVNRAPGILSRAYWRHGGRTNESSNDMTKSGLSRDLALRAVNSFVCSSNAIAPDAGAHLEASTSRDRRPRTAPTLG